MGYANNVVPSFIADDPEKLSEFMAGWYGNVKEAGLEDLKEEAEEYVAKRDYEGNILDLLEYGGVTVFPKALQWIAAEVQRAVTVFEQAEDAYLHRMEIDG